VRTLKSSLTQTRSFWSSSVRSSTLKIKALHILIKWQRTAGYSASPQSAILTTPERKSGVNIGLRLHSAVNGSSRKGKKIDWHGLFGTKAFAYYRSWQITLKRMSEQVSVRLFPWWPVDVVMWLTYRTAGLKDDVHNSCIGSEKVKIKRSVYNAIEAEWAIGLPWCLLVWATKRNKLPVHIKSGTKIYFL